MNYIHYLIDKKPIKFLISNIIGFNIILILIGFSLFSFLFFEFNSLILSISISIFLKGFTKVSRYEVKNILDYRFPSLHCAVTFSMVLTSIFICKYFIFSIVYLFIVVENRLKYGNHTEFEVVYGINVGVISFYLSYLFWVSL